MGSGYHFCLFVCFLFFFVFLFCFSRQGFSVALEPVLELALVDQAGLELTEIRLPLPPELFVCFLKTGFLCSFGACPGTNSCRPGWSRTHRDPLASAPRVPGLKVCATATQFVFVFQDLEFLCYSSGCHGAHFVDQAGLGLTEICLPLSPECWD